MTSSFLRMHKETMLKLRKLLSDTDRTYRHHRNVLNILITMLAWMVEFVGALTIFLGSFVFGHGNNVITLTLQTLTLFFYFDILPCTFLINEDEWKLAMVDNYWYTQFIKVLDFCLSNRPKPLETQMKDDVEAKNHEHEAIANDIKEEGA